MDHPQPVRPLAIYAPGGAPLAHIKQAKAALDLDFQVMPMQAVPGGSERVLAFAPPTFICDHALVKRPEALGAALLYVLRVNDDPRGTSMAKHLEQFFGPGVVELEPEPVESSVRFT